jgi:hypothetical protein
VILKELRVWTVSWKMLRIWKVNLGGVQGSVWKVSLQGVKRGVECG